jgi:hypothetical protein
MNSKKFIVRLAIFLLAFFVIDLATSAFMLKGINKFYGFNSRPALLINGSSMSLSGFNKAEIEKQLQTNVAIYAKEGVGVEDRHAMLQQFFTNRSPSVKTVIYELNPLLFSKTLTAANVYTIFYPFMDNAAIDSYIHARAPVKEYFAHKLFRSSRFDALTINLAVKGYLNKYENFKTNAIDPGTAYFTANDAGKVVVEMSPDKVTVFEESLTLIRQHNAKVVLVMMPIYYQKKATFDSSSYKLLDNYFRRLAATEPTISFLDLNNTEITRNAMLYSDVLHLNREGQKSVTAAIVNFFKTPGKTDLTKNR